METTNATGEAAGITVGMIVAGMAGWLAIDQK